MTTYNHNVDITRHGITTSWYVGPKERTDYPSEKCEYGTLIEHWPDGKQVYRERRNHATVIHTFTPRPKEPTR